MRLVYVDESYCRDCYYIEPTAELHGYDLFQGKGHWEPMKRMPRARIGVYDQALRAIADHDVTMIIRGVMTPRLRDRYGDRAWPPTP